MFVRPEEEEDVSSEGGRRRWSERRTKAVMSVGRTRRVGMEHENWRRAERVGEEEADDEEEVEEREVDDEEAGGQGRVVCIVGRAVEVPSWTERGGVYALGEMQLGEGRRR